MRHPEEESRFHRIIRVVLVMLAVAVLAIYIWIGRSHWFSEIERQYKKGTASFSSGDLDLSKKSIFVWRIKREDWKETGLIKLALRVERKKGIPREVYSKRTTNLSVGVKVHAEEVRNPNADSPQIWDRLIHNWYYGAEDPMSQDARIWVSSRQTEREFGLGGFQRYMFEDSIITVEIKTAEPRLDGVRAWLTVVAKHDSAIFHHIWKFRLLRDVSAGLCTALILWLAYLSIRRFRPKGQRN